MHFAKVLTVATSILAATVYGFGCDKLRKEKGYCCREQLSVGGVGTDCRFFRSLKKVFFLFFWMVLIRASGDQAFFSYSFNCPEQKSYGVCASRLMSQVLPLSSEFLVNQIPQSEFSAVVIGYRAGQS